MKIDRNVITHIRSAIHTESKAAKQAGNYLPPRTRHSRDFVLNYSRQRTNEQSWSRHAHLTHRSPSCTAVEHEEVDDGRFARSQRLEDILRKHTTHHRTYGRQLMRSGSCNGPKGHPIHQELRSSRLTTEYTYCKTSYGTTGIACLLTCAFASSVSVITFSFVASLASSGSAPPCVAWYSHSAI